MRSKSRAGAFAEGFRAPGEGWAFLGAHPELWRYAWLPVLFNLIFFLALLGGMLYGISGFSEWAREWMPQAWEWSLVRIVADIILVIAALGLAAVSAFLLSTLFASYSYSRLAARVEILQGTPPSELGSVSILGETIDTGVALVELGLVSLFVLALPLVPVVGSALSPVVAWYFDSFIAGMKYLEFPLALRGLRRAEIRALARRHRFHTLGLGSAIFLFQLVPVIGSFALITAAVGATLLAHRMREPSLH